MGSLFGTHRMSWSSDIVMMTWNFTCKSTISEFLPFCAFNWCHRYTSVKMTVFTARCTLVQSAVLRSHVVCLSVCDVGGLWSHRLTFDTRHCQKWVLTTTVCDHESQIKFNMQHIHWETIYERRTLRPYGTVMFEAVWFGGTLSYMACCIMIWTQ